MSQVPTPGIEMPNPSPLPPSANGPRRWGRRARAALGRGAAGLGISAAVHLAAIAPAQADVLTKMNGYFEEAGAAANVSGPSAFEGQSAGYYSMGNVWTRFPQRSVAPFNLQLPSARAGCGGIDLFAGSFSFINTAELVAMLKATANNALGFAFKLAIDSVSPEIGKVMDEFSQKVQQLNQMNINSCETAQALVGGIWPKMETTRSTICEAVGNSQGMFSDWAASRQGCNNGNRRDSTIAGNSDPAMKDQLVGERHNYTWEALRKANNFGGFDQQFSELIMTLVGTIVTIPSTDPSVGGRVQIIGPAEEAVATALLDATPTAPVTILKCNDADCFNVGRQTLSVPVWIALKPRIARNIREMGDKIRTDTPLTPIEKQLLNISSVPLFKILSVQAFAHRSLAQGDIDNLAEIVATDLLIAMLDNFLDKVQQAQTHYQTFDAETAAQWRKQIADARERYSQRDIKLSNKMQLTTQLIDQTIMLESTLQNSMSPGMTAALSFSRGLNAQGLQ